ncbi:MAG: penicillin-binding transpeptidase domain-containing protein [Bacteroidales bacterium]
MKFSVLLSMVLFTFSLFGQKKEVIDLKSFYGNFTGGFCIYDIKTDKYIQYNPEHCKIRFSPCSTFKIPNSLIGLETGVIPDTAFVIKYDSIRHPKDANNMETEPFKHWYEDLSLKNAFKYSCVWYYQELARRVGQDKMLELVRSLNYGNKDISGGIDNFWLCSSLEISIDEQVEFLKQFYSEKLAGISTNTTNDVKSIMLYESTPQYKLYGKTGTGDCMDNKVIGWYVGFLETSTGTKIFAMNIIVNNFNDLSRNFRIELTKKVFKKLKFI